MRFAVFISLVLALPASALAQPGQTYALDAEVISRPVSAPINFQNRPGGTSPKTISGLSVHSLATGLGHITSIAYAPNGAILVADTQKNRILSLEDRGRDNRIDSRRKLSEGFQNLASIAVIGETLYMTDQQAVWQMPISGGPRTEFVSLRRIDASPENRPLLADPDNNRLLLGLNTKGAAKVIAIDIKSGRASLLAQGPGQITALAKPEKGAIWAGLSGALVPVIQGQGLDVTRGQILEPDVSIPALLVPGQYDEFDGWPDEMKAYVLAAQVPKTRLPSTSSGGFNVVALPTIFGHPQAELNVLVDGFLTRSGRSAWGYPAALAMDARGLLMADPESGTLWQVRKSARKPVVIKAPVAKAITKPKKTAKKKPALGSHIDEGSQIGSASGLTLGSTIVRDYEKRKEEEAKKKAAEEGTPN